MTSKKNYFRPILIVADRPAVTVHSLRSSYTWVDFLTKIAKRPNSHRGATDRCSDVAVPVDAFQFTPFGNYMKHYCLKNLMVEAPVLKEYVSEAGKEFGEPLYWFATILKTAGYRLLLRYVGVDNEEGKTYDFWHHIASTDLKHVGYCSEDVTTRHMVVPDMVSKKQKDWDNYALSQIHACHSIAFNWPKIQKECVNDWKFQAGNRVELLDTIHSNRVRPARVERVVGHRVFVRLCLGDIYPERIGADDEQVAGIWVEHDSPLLFYVGWSCKVGYGLCANNDYKMHANEVAVALKSGRESLPLADQDANPKLFVTFEEHPILEEGVILWKKGMKMEVLDPADTYKELRSGTVLDVLADGYLRIGFKGDQEDEDHIPIHCSSPLLFPVGYAEKYGIKLKGPQDEYITGHAALCSGSAAPEALFDNITDHLQEIECFKVGAKLEAADMCDAKLICPATVASRKGRLLEISYDGWDKTYNQLFDFRSNDIFPLGWCEMYGYKLEAPAGQSVSTPSKKQRKG